MRVTIIRDDNKVVVNGEPHTVDCSDLPADFHALQWDGASGEVEHAAVTCTHCNGRSKKPNQAITDATPYQKYLDAWNVAKTETDRKAAEAELAAEAARKARVNDAAG